MGFQADIAPPNPYSQIINSLSSGTVALDAHNCVITANPAACRHLEVPHGALAPGTHFDTLPGIGPITDIIGEIRGGGGPVSRREIRLEHEDSAPRIIGLTASLLEGPEPYNGVILLFVDLTEVRRLEHVARVNQELAQIGELTAGVVHELRNPLSVISGMCELLLRRLEEGTRAHKHASAILKETNELHKTITQFLKFARPFELKVEPHDPTHIVARAVQLVETIAQTRNVRLSSPAAGSATIIQADPAKLAQALGNIMANAVEVAPEETGEVSVCLEIEDDVAVFQVEDNGPGVHLQSGENLFSPFFSRKKGGTGLGLSIVQRIVTAHGGTVHYGNREEGGAWFALRIPRQPGEET
ncbi:MAG: sensor histidine kinase [Candidatus Hydrogenedentota bacterium]